MTQTTTQLTQNHNGMTQNTTQLTQKWTIMTHENPLKCLELKKENK